MHEQVLKAGDIIRKGGTILYPTDTIWGIGCDATNQNAIQKILNIKHRPDKKSMLVLMNGISMLSEYLDQIPDSAYEIIHSAQKPTTIIYPQARNF
ncbi:MAG: translation factor Sua5, partial [Bacteroidetes bacterium]